MQCIIRCSFVIYKETHIYSVILFVQLVLHRCLDAKDRSGGKKLSVMSLIQKLPLTHTSQIIHLDVVRQSHLYSYELRRGVCVNASVCEREKRGNTFCKSWDPEYFEAIDFISPPNAEAQSFTLLEKSLKLQHIMPQY